MTGGKGAGKLWIIVVLPCAMIWVHLGIFCRESWGEVVDVVVRSVVSEVESEQLTGCVHHYALSLDLR